MTRLLSKLFGKTPTIRNVAKRAARTRLVVEGLEDRLAPATVGYDPALHTLQMSGQITFVGNNNNSVEINLGGTDSLTASQVSGLNASAGSQASFTYDRASDTLYERGGGLQNLTVIDNNDVVTVGWLSLPGKLSITGGAVAVQPGANVTAQGDIQLTGHGTAPTPVGVSIPAGATVRAGNSVTLDGTGANSSAYNNAGVLVSGGTVTAGDGGVTITGHGHGTGNNEDGIDLWNAATVSATGSGAVNLYGYASPNGHDGDFGVCVTTGSNSATSNTNSPAPAGSHTQVSTANGQVYIHGEGGGSGRWNYGIAVSTGGTVQATGTGTVKFSGFGGAGTDWNEGVLATTGGTVASVNGWLELDGISHGTGTGNNGVDLNGSALVKTSTGALGISGNGSGNGSGNSGVAIYGGAVVQGAAPEVAGSGSEGYMTVTGTGSPTGTTYNEGVYVDGAGTQVNSSGRLTLTGNSSGTGSSNYAVTVDGGARVFSGQDMTIFGTCTATGPDATNADFGVNITGAGTWINSSQALSISGYGSGCMNWDYGIGVQAGASVDGNSVTLTGVGSPDAVGTMADGVFLSGANASSGWGNMEITGTGGKFASGTAGVSINGSTVYALHGSNVNVFGSAGQIGDGVDVGTGSSVWAPSGRAVLVGYGHSGPGVYEYAGNAVTGGFGRALIPLSVYHGTPTADPIPVGDAAGGYTQTYPNGYTMVWSPSDGAHYIHGAIGAKYQSLGGPWSVFHYPTSDEIPTASGFIQYFDGGSISWTPATGAQLYYVFTQGDMAGNSAGQPAITDVYQYGDQITINWSSSDYHAKFVLGYSVNGGAWTTMDFDGGRGGSFTLPVTSGATYSFSVEWGDPKTFLGGLFGWNYSPASTYTVTAL
jgi:hypothetical protein